MSELPAALGGTPIFSKQVNIVRPFLPDISELNDGIKNILDTGMVTKGRYLVQFEGALARHLGVKHAVAVSSCTSGLMLTHKALGLSGEVIVPSFTFMATISSLIWCGLRPIFADVDRATTNLDPDAVEAAISSQTSAILAVHNFGNPADIIGLQAVADRHHIPLIFDAAHGFGALFQGEPIGKQGKANVFSLSPTKLLIAGEGGVVATEDDDLAQMIRIGREYGNNGNYDSLIAGLNARLPEFNAVLGLKSLDMLEKAAQARNELANMYQELMGKLPGIGFQQIRPDNRCSYKDFSITVDNDIFGLSRDALWIALRTENIDTRKYYDPPVHRQIAYKSFDDRFHLPNTEWLAEHSLSFPIWSNMDEKTALGICEAVHRIYNHRGAINDRIKQHLVLSSS
jgi:dTDP-4-amino-4,6-dideoxygalactose transaminase